MVFGHQHYVNTLLALQCGYLLDDIICDISWAFALHTKKNDVTNKENMSHILGLVKDMYAGFIINPRMIYEKQIDSIWFVKTACSIPRTKRVEVSSAFSVPIVV